MSNLCKYKRHLNAKKLRPTTQNTSGETAQAQQPWYKIGNMHFSIVTKVQHNAMSQTIFKGIRATQQQGENG